MKTNLITKPTAVPTFEQLFDVNGGSIITAKWRLKNKVPQAWWSESSKTAYYDFVDTMFTLYSACCMNYNTNTEPMRALSVAASKSMDKLQGSALRQCLRMASQRTH